MSDFESRPVEELIESNPLVDGDQLEQARQALTALRRAGFSGPSYKIESPYERRGMSEPTSIVGDEDKILPPRC